MDSHHNNDRNDADSTPNRPMSVSDIKESYDEYADQMDRFEWIDSVILGRYRRARFGDVEGRVLDVACGTGTNFKYLPDSVDLVGIDISPEMLANATKQLAELEIDGNLKEMDAQELKFADDSFNAVISSLSTCTFPDPVAVLREMERVCKPDGTIRLVEHGRSDIGPMAKYQEWRADAHYEKTGCRWTQEPRELVSEAGLDVRNTNTGLFGTITTFEITPNQRDQR
nr:class I SAM-dependent methyltransferase [Halorubrum californiense]